ncbi:YlbD family protein [Mesobacillus maritimus]|uniref:YlbD family protein n=1 Tax=Mesobacillus maritimus TaxID=1643336 RepID=UPI00203DAFDF|nr:YlbD family protein [Mesobacillus maritimus]MCM3587065.1 YlbD family protein [Mesobacillus maritimus]MCM3667630.1 YlbD family protein [Mesobacillus maritimus]
MAGKRLHPSVQQFKAFVKNNPGLIKEVRDGKATWQELYEDWYLLGEEDSRWESFKDTSTESSKEKTESKSEKSSEWMPKIISMVKNMDQEQLQGQIGNISQAIAAIQGVLSQFQGSQPSSQSPKSNNAPKHPFSFRKD